MSHLEEDSHKQTTLDPTSVIQGQKSEATVDRCSRRGRPFEDLHRMAWHGERTWSHSLPIAPYSKSQQKSWSFTPSKTKLCWIRTALQLFGFRSVPQPNSWLLNPCRTAEIDRASLSIPAVNISSVSTIVVLGNDRLSIYDEAQSLGELKLFIEQTTREESDGFPWN